MDYHLPVLIDEVIKTLKPDSTKTFVDCTLGNGGHTKKLLELGAKIIAFEADKNNIEIVKNRIQDPRLTIINDNFVNLSKHLTDKVDGILFDLGLSVNQQKADNRGFSFNDENSLDMRLDPTNQELTAEEIINTYSYEQLFDIFSKISQEKLSKPLAIRIISSRKHHPIKTATRLADIIRSFYKEKHIRTSIDPATKIFMALRIVVNNEFENLKSALNQTLNLVKPSGTVCVISFHSGEDRIVKQFIREHHLKNTMSLPSQEEIQSNPLSRSSVLRCFQIE